MLLLEMIDKPQSDIEAYVTHLDTILIQKMDMISTVREKLVKFYQNVKKEEALQVLYRQTVPDSPP